MNNDDDDYADDDFESDNDNNNNNNSNNNSNNNNNSMPKPLRSSSTPLDSDERKHSDARRAQERQLGAARGAQLLTVPDDRGRDVKSDLLRHRFRVSVDVRSVRDLEAAYTVFARYVYPAFGSTAPVTTHPPVEVPKLSECLLPNSFCTFEFAMSEEDLVATFDAEPLIVELIHKDRYASDTELGIAKVDLRTLLTAEVQQSKQKNERGVPHSLRVMDVYSTVFTLEGQKVLRRGAVRVVLSLEDFGPLPDHQQQAYRAQGVAAAAGGDGGGPNDNNNDNGDGDGGGNPRQQLEYQMAWELEMWRRAEQAKFEAHWKQVESSRMAVLESEWKKQEMMREKQVARQQQAVVQLEKKLKQTLFSVEAQQQRLSMAEEALKKRKTMLQQEFDQHKHEAMLTIRRVRAQHKHEMELLNKRLEDVERRNALLKKQLVAAEAKHKHTSTEFEQYRRKMDKSLNAKLRAELTTSEARNEELQQQLDAARHSTHETKMQLVKCLREIAHLRRLREEDNEAAMQKERAELQRMRLQYMAQRNRNGIGRGVSELHDIKAELQKLMQSQSASTSTSLSASSASVAPPPKPTPKPKQGQEATALVHAGESKRDDKENQQQQHAVEEADSLTTKTTVAAAADTAADTAGADSSAVAPATPTAPESSEADRLRAQRSKLLATGVYEANHPLVRELDRRISAISSNLLH
eukprot:TRINITY_DN66633_c7_g5_i1.p1 TRINITY_DN66633_c7_g5~~TRINITY_DN66633_c7_g5_i1.p1  ORF type:complete len:694 (-),score=388.03 TRINITY_DN66633_c7_g5_i1:14-2095(-)